jgi:hypothetical protein
MLNVGVHFYVRQPAGLRVLSYVRQHGSTRAKYWLSLTVDPGMGVQCAEILQPQFSLLRAPRRRGLLSDSVQEDGGCPVRWAVRESLVRLLGVAAA